MANPTRSLVDSLDRRIDVSEVGDFKDPLSTIQLALRDALEVPSAFLTLSARADRDVRIALRASERMQAMVDSSAEPRVDDSAVIDRRERVKPASFLAGLVDEYRILARERGVALRLALSTSLPALHVDRQRLARALANVVGCAIRSTPPGGVVTVTAASRAGDVVFTIRDSGADDGSTFRIAVPAPTDD
jgi:signal transduction histidine kinase